jgi:hypothetical protein
VDREEHVTARALGAGRALFERHGRIAASRHHDVEAAALEALFEIERYGQRHVLLAKAARAEGAGVGPSVARVDDDRVDTPQPRRQTLAPAPGRRRLARRRGRDRGCRSPAGPVDVDQ